MVQAFENSYFYKLPIEILIKILTNVDTLTLLDFCKTYNYDNLLQIQSVVRTVNLEREYRLYDLSFSKRIAYEHVTTLNVNCLYWIEVAELREFITKLVNLETLYAIDTKLQLTPSDVEVYANSKIKKLGISLNKKEDFKGLSVPRVETLYVKVLYENFRNSQKFENFFPCVRNLWIDGEIIVDDFMLFLKKESIEKIFFKGDKSSSVISFDEANKIYYQRYGKEMCWEKHCLKRSEPKKIAGNLTESWKNLSNCDFTNYGPRDARRLHLNENSLEDISWEGLNLFHTHMDCHIKYRQSVREVLKSGTAKKVRKLHVMTCLFYNDSAQELVDDQSCSISLKEKERIEDIFRNIPELTHLKIEPCRNEVSDNIDNRLFHLITLFTNLEHLTIDLPEICDGTFFIDILKQCTRLGQLCVNTYTWFDHEFLSVHLGVAIPNATSLRDFQFKSQRIKLDHLLERLSLLNHLERVVFSCNEIGSFSDAILRRFLDANPRLTFIFFNFEISVVPESVMKTIRGTFDVYRKKHPSRLFMTRNQYNDSSFNDSTIPDFHDREMVECDNGIAGLDALTNFVTF